jgi:hypothetical protein
VVIDDREPQQLATRQLHDGEPFDVYDLVKFILGVMARMVAWQSYRQKTRDDFDAIVEQLGDVA